eukprot:4465046-Prymnesium_polylepis.1
MSTSFDKDAGTRTAKQRPEISPTGAEEGAPHPTIGGREGSVADGLKVGHAGDDEIAKSAELAGT